MPAKQTTTTVTREWTGKKRTAPKAKRNKSPKPNTRKAKATTKKKK